MLIASPLTLKCRPIDGSDMAFLAQLYATTRATELAITGWSTEQKTFFLNSQFQLQHNYYQQQFAEGKFQIIEVNEAAIGRLYYGWDANDLRLIDIALLPEYQGKGIGRQLMQDLMMQVKEKSGTLSLHVDINNRARNWYVKLGFSAVDDLLVNGIYQKMQWCAS